VIAGLIVALTVALSAAVVIGARSVGDREQPLVSLSSEENSSSILVRLQRPVLA
jgi:hypothetical protein